MLPVLFLALAVLLTALLDGVAAERFDLAKAYQSRIRYAQTVALAENIEQHYLDTGAFPASPTALGAASGYEHTRSLTDSWHGYTVSPILSDGTWQYQRLVLYSRNPATGATAAEFLADNHCGTGGPDTAASWCGSPDSRWFRRESRERYNELLTTQRVRMDRMLQKLANYYNKAGSFPDKDNLGTPLAADSMTPLKTLAGYGGLAGNCTGTYTYMGVPVDCGDMYDLWGAPVGYQFLGAKHVLLVSETPLFNGAGNRLVVSREYDGTLW